MKALPQAFCMVCLSLFITPASISIALAENLWMVDYTKSKITFSGTQSGKTFSGTISNYKAKVDFDPQNLSSTKVDIEFPADFILTGDTTFDQTLKSAEWLNLSKFPIASFHLIKIYKACESLPCNDYWAEGELRLGGITRALRFQVNIAIDKNDIAKASSTFSLHRLDYDIGKKADPNADWVSDNIEINVNLIAY